MVKAFIGGVEGHALTHAERDFLGREQPYGIILFARNIDNPAQVRALVHEIKEVLGHRYASVLIDQEGGRVARLKPPHWRAYPPAAKLAAGPNPERSIYVNARLIAQELRAAGITTDCAPVADVLAPECHKIIGDRAFGDTAEQVARLAKAQADGLLDGGILPIIKHIPGHGRATQDSHVHLPVVNTSLKELEASDFIPFKALNDIPLAMTAHVIYTALDDKLCATVSPTVVKYIREQIGFDGLLMSDDLSMKALTGSFAEKTEQTLAAGCDLVLHGNGALIGEPVRNLMAELQEIAAVCPAMTPEACKRADNAISMLPGPLPKDDDALLIEWQSLLAAA